MSIDVERALRASLDEHARHAPDGADLAGRIIAEAGLPPNVSSLRQARSWHSWGLPLLAAAVVAAVVGIGVGISQWQLGASGHQQSGHSLGAPAPTAPVESRPAPSPQTSAPTLPVGPPPATNPVGVTGFRVRDITFVGPNTGFAIGTARCTSGSGRCSAFVYTTDGTHWNNRPNTTPFNVPGVSAGCASKCVEHVRFANARTGYVYGPSYLAMTTDGGAHWTPQPGGALALETLDNNVIRAVRAGSTLTAQTSGVGSSTWTTAPLHAAVGRRTHVQLARTDSAAYLLVNTLVSGVERSTLFASSDDGGTWTRSGEPCAFSSKGEVQGTAIAAAPGGISITCVGQSSDRYVEISHDRGIHFAHVSDQLPAPVESILAGDPATVLVAAGHGAYRSTDGGKTWSHIADLGDATISFLGFENRHDGRAVTNSGRTIYTTHDGGKTWTPYTFR